MITKNDFLDSIHRSNSEIKTVDLYRWNGVSSLDQMRGHYNSFSEGGNVGPDDPPKASKQLDDYFLEYMDRFQRGLDVSGYPDGSYWRNVSADAHNKATQQWNRNNAEEKYMETPHRSIMISDDESYGVLPPVEIIADRIKPLVNIYGDDMMHESTPATRFKDRVRRRDGYQGVLYGELGALGLAGGLAMAPAFAPVIDYSLGNIARGAWNTAKTMAANPARTLGDIVLFEGIDRFAPQMWGSDNRLHQEIGNVAANSPEFQSLFSLEPEQARVFGELTGMIAPTAAVDRLVSKGFPLVENLTNKAVGDLAKGAKRDVRGFPSFDPDIIKMLESKAAKGDKDAKRKLDFIRKRESLKAEEKSIPATEQKNKTKEYYLSSNYRNRLRNAGLSESEIQDEISRHTRAIDNAETVVVPDNYSVLVNNGVKTPQGIIPARGLTSTSEFSGNEVKSKVWVGESSLHMDDVLEHELDHAAYFNASPRIKKHNDMFPVDVRNENSIKYGDDYYYTNQVELRRRAQAVDRYLMDHPNLSYDDLADAYEYMLGDKPLIAPQEVLLKDLWEKLKREKYKFIYSAPIDVIDFFRELKPGQAKNYFNNFAELAPPVGLGGHLLNEDDNNWSVKIS